MQLTIKQKLTTLALLFLVITIIETVMSFSHVSKIQNDTSDFINRTLPSIKAFHELEMNVVQVQQWLTDISATRGQDGLNDGFDVAAKHAERFNKDIAKLSELNPDLAAPLTVLKSRFSVYYSEGKSMAEAYISGGPQAGNKLMSDFDKAAEALNEKVESLAIVIEAQQNQSLSNMKEDSDSTATQSSIAVLLLVIFLLATATAVQMLLLSPLARFKRVISHFNDGTASLSYRFGQKGKDEITAIANELDTFFGSLQIIMVELDNQANHLEQKVTETASVAHKNHQGVMAQQQEIELVTAAVEEMSATSMDVAEKTEMTAAETNRAKELATKGSQAVTTTIESINRVSTKISDTTSTMKQLAMDTEKIEAMLDVIKSIAEQTNLLALNAAIEAARAGEQGRGFAVVADEVRTLAGKTQDSTSEINEIITSLQNVSGNAVQLMNENCQEVEECVSKAAQSDEFMLEISAATERMSDMATQIAAAMEQQTAVSGEIANSLIRVHDVSIETAEGSELTTSSMEDLTGNAKTLLEMAHQFSAET